MPAALQVLGKYRILEELGRGGFATVYRAEDSTLGREVALKVLHPQLLNDPDGAKRFRQEARTIAQMQHPHIITIYETGEAKGRHYVAMEYMTAGSLSKRLEQQGRLPWNEALELLGQMADALDYVHAKGILHNDLKPANILLDSHTGVVITDFGLAGGTTTTQTVTGPIMGTPHYLAPELWNAQPASKASDLYAMGCIAYEILFGCKAFPGDTAPSIMAAHLRPLTLPEKLPADVPASAGSVLRKALAHKPEERYGSASEMVTALSKSIQKIQATPHPVKSRKSKKSAVRTLDVLDRIAHMLRDTGLPFWVWGLVLLASVLNMSVWLGFIVVIPNLFERIVVSPPAKLGDTYIRQSDDMPMVYVPTGEFQMGSFDSDINTVLYQCSGCSRDWYADEQPAHSVTLDGFWLDQTEVTQAQYQKCVTSGTCAAPRTDEDSPSKGALKPVVNISWYDAEAYCNWVGGRLPTEAEWEYAARGPEGRTYPWGDQLPTCSLANYRDEYGGCMADTAAVGNYPESVSWVGAVDLAGNVWEWVADWYAAYPLEPASNPAGPDTGTYRVLRGGSWYSVGRALRSAHRYRDLPTHSGGTYGFRCATSTTARGD